MAKPPRKFLGKVGQALGSPVKTLGPKIGTSLGETFKGTVGGGWGRDIGGPMFESAFGSKTAGRIGGALGQAGMGISSLNLLGKYLAPKAYELMGGGKKADGTKVIPQEEQKKRDKIYKDVMGGLSGDYQPEDLDHAHMNSDEGWRKGISAFSKEEFNKMAKSAIDSNDVLGLWNSVARKARAQGKPINSSKPLYIPGVFEKDGKQYAYAIDASGVTKKEKPTLVKIEMGKGVVFDE
jgi:hypothetical protein